ncbi:hypothetical protein BH10PSE7_BH10PSE7_12180 [soil metagenome]
MRQIILAIALLFSVSAFAAERHADPELEALLPKTLGGVVLIIESQSGADLAARGAAFEGFLNALGKTRADFAVASAYARSGLKAAMSAWRVRGAAGSDLLAAFKTAMQASSATALTTGEEKFAGRDITRIGGPDELAQGPLYVILRGDVLLFVQTPERALAEEAVGKFPR